MATPVCVLVRVYLRGVQENGDWVAFRPPQTQSRISEASGLWQTEGGAVPCAAASPENWRWLQEPPRARLLRTRGCVGSRQRRRRAWGREEHACAGAGGKKARARARPRGPWSRLSPRPGEGLAPLLRRSRRARIRGVALLEAAPQCPTKSHPHDPEATRIDVLLTAVWLLGNCRRQTKPYSRLQSARRFPSPAYLGVAAPALKPVSAPS